MKPKLAFALTLIVLLIVFFFQNTDPAPIKFLFWEKKDMTLSVTIMVSALIGLGLGLILPRILNHNKEEHYKLEKNMPKKDEPIAE